MCLRKNALFFTYDKLLAVSPQCGCNNVMSKVHLWGYRCERCGQEWLPRRSERPRVCLKCKIASWNGPRTSDSGKNKKGESWNGGLCALAS